MDTHLLAIIGSMHPSNSLRPCELKDHVVCTNHIDEPTARTKQTLCTRQTRPEETKNTYQRTAWTERVTSVDRSARTGSGKRFTWGSGAPLGQVSPRRAARYLVRPATARNVTGTNSSLVRGPVSASAHLHSRPHPLPPPTVSRPPTPAVTGRLICHHFA